MAKKSKAPSYEHCPPHQEKYVHGTDGWDIPTTALPVDNIKVASHPGDANVVDKERARYTAPITSDYESRNIVRSTTDGKEGR